MIELLLVAILGLLVLAILAITFGVIVFRDAARARVFVACTSRYAEIADRLFHDLDARSTPLDQYPPPRRDELLRLARRYYNLSSEEFYLNERGMLDPAAWRVWEDGIREVSRLPLMRSAWSELSDSYSSYPQFVTFIDDLQVANVASPRRSD